MVDPSKTINIDDLILIADAFVLPVDVKVSHGLFRRGVSLGSVLRSIKTHAQCQTATAYDEGNMEEIARDSDLAEIEALRKRIDFAADALGVVERRRDTLKAERDTARAALRIFVSRAKSWHDFHHGSDTIQCDALCEAIPIGEAALGSPPETKTETALAAPLKDFNGTKYHICDAQGLALCNGLETEPSLQIPAQRVEHSRCNRKACRMNYPSFRSDNVVIRNGNP